jgi:hypothetical protein
MTGLIGGRAERNANQRVQLFKVLLVINLRLAQAPGKRLLG